jgi:HAD superfamily hydrolase (TIGR01509 family)
MYKAIIFDLDGTLIDSMFIWVEMDIRFLNKRNIPISKDMFDDLQTNSFKDMAVYFKDKFALTETIEEIINEWVTEAKYAYENELKLKPHSLDFIKYLKDSGYLLAVGTSNELSLTQAVLDSNGILEYFDTIVTGCSGLRGKPAPDIYLQVAKNLGVVPEECLVIEDTFVGVMAAKNAGMSVFAIADRFSLGDKDRITQNADGYFEDYVGMVGACNK